MPLAEDSSATAAVKQAWGNSKTARWSSEKAAMDPIGRLHHKRAGNKGRDFANHLKREGLMLGCPISWISHALCLENKNHCLLDSVSIVFENLWLWSSFWVSPKGGI